MTYPDQSPISPEPVNRFAPPPNGLSEPPVQQAGSAPEQVSGHPADQPDTQPAAYRSSFAAPGGLGTEYAAQASPFASPGGGGTPYGSQPSQPETPPVPLPPTAGYNATLHQEVFGQVPSPFDQDHGSPYSSIGSGPLTAAGYFGESQIPHTPYTPKKRGLGFGAVTGLVLLSLVAGAGGGVLATKFLPGASTTAGKTVITQVGPGDSDIDLSRTPGSVADTAARVLPSVVSIQVASGGGFSTGSGFVLTEDGYIITNDHVIQEAKDGGTVTVAFADGQEYTAELIGSTVEYDLAVIRVERDGLQPLALADSDALVVGDQVIAIGAPLGLEGTVTTGIISALNRPVTAGDVQSTSYINAVQTDAAINPGNSGGPLVNVAGEVIGVNSAIAQTPSQLSGTTGSIGLGFAIASNQVGRTAAQIIENGYATYPIIGVLLNSVYAGEGVQIVPTNTPGQPAVTPGGPGALAGLEPGEIILAINGRPVTQSDELIVAIRAKAPGDEVELTVRNGSKERKVTMVLGEAKSE